MIQLLLVTAIRTVKEMAQKCELRAQKFKHGEHDKRINRGAYDRGKGSPVRYQLVNNEVLIGVSVHLLHPKKYE